MKENKGHSQQQLYNFILTPSEEKKLEIPDPCPASAAKADSVGANDCLLLLLFILRFKIPITCLSTFLQVRFQRNDHSVIRDIADEFRNFEGIRHPNLVRYHGVEIHRVMYNILSYFVCNLDWREELPRI